MIDLHIHILPGLDDGASSLEEARQMLQICAEDGVHTLVATPHVIREAYYHHRETILNAVFALRENLRQMDLPLQILPGSDVRLDYDIGERLDRNEICTINDGNKYILLEIPETLSVVDITRSFSSLKKRGIRPIVSHPERCPLFREQPELLYNFVYSEVLLQVTAGSLLGKFGEDAKRFTEKLLTHRLVHIMASDAHSPTIRKPGLRDALQRASGLLGDEEAEKLVKENPALVIRGEPINLPAPVPWNTSKKTGWWRIFSK